MGRLVAIAGGSLRSTVEINKFCIQLCGKPDANVLLISTGCRDAQIYIDSFQRAYESLGCKTDFLCLTRKIYSDEEIDELLVWADIIYVGGGDPVYMLAEWKTVGLDKKLRQIYENDKAVLAGMSAGAICWFSCGYSDSEYVKKVNGCRYGWADHMLGLYEFAFCPHYDEEGRETFDASLKEKGLRGLAFENNTAFVDNHGKIEFIRVESDKKAYSLHFSEGKFVKQPLPVRDI